MLRVAGSMADGVIIEGCGVPPVLDAALEQIARGAAAAGRDPGSLDVVARLDVAVDASIDRAYDALRLRVARHLINAAPSFERFALRGLDVPPHLREIAGQHGYTHDPAVLQPIGAQLPREYIDAFCIAATPATLDERFAPLLARGVTQIIVNPVAPVGDAVEPIIDAIGAWRGERGQVRRDG
jgi:5,10-methylenetetrahydromethanopterin reductase